MTTPAPPSPEPAFARVLLALSGVAREDPALAVAIELAARLKLDLHGLLLEDPRVAAAAELPITREITASRGMSRALDPERLRRQRRAEEAETRRALARGADSSGVRWSLEVTGGFVGGELVATLGATPDLVVLAPRVHSRHRTRACAARPIVALLEPSEASRRAVALAARLAAPAGESALAVLAADTTRGEDPRREVARLDARLVVIGADPARWSRERIDAWMTEIRCPTVLVS